LIFLSPSPSFLGRKFATAKERAKLGQSGRLLSFFLFPGDGGRALSSLSFSLQACWQADSPSFSWSQRQKGEQSSVKARI
jgi:hypothetical protein